MLRIRSLCQLGKQDFDVMTELSDRLDLRTNVANIMSMACNNCRAFDGSSDEAYGFRTNREGHTYREMLC